MKAPRKVYCLFEQSGTFKQTFIENGIDAVDIDIDNTFGQTDMKLDIFGEIDRCIQGEETIFSAIGSDDLIMAFFPCTFFSAQSNLCMSFSSVNNAKLSREAKYDQVTERARLRFIYYTHLINLFRIAERNKLRMIVENPWHCSYLRGNFIYFPSLIDYNRRLRGDSMRKPTAYWFVNCHPSRKYTTMEMSKGSATIANTNGIQRSVIDEKYARHFVLDYILAKPDRNSQLNLFEL